jgi:hypothetical protein
VSSCSFAQLSWFSVYASTAISWSCFLAAVHFSPAAIGLRAREHSFVRSQIFAAGLPSLLDLPAGLLDLSSTSPDFLRAARDRVFLLCGSSLVSKRSLPSWILAHVVFGITGHACSLRP